MTYKTLARTFLRLPVALSLLVAASPVFAAESAWDAAGTRSAALKWELSYLTLSAIDAAVTIDCLNRNVCVEGNPILGKKPSASKLILGKVALGALHFAVFNRIGERNPKAALRVAQVSAAVQGSVVMLNARFTLK